MAKKSIKDLIRPRQSVNDLDDRDDEDLPSFPKKWPVVCIPQTVRL